MPRHLVTRDSTEPQDSARAAARTADGPLELTAAQAHVLDAQRADPDNTTYNVGQYVDLQGPLDAALLQEAVGRGLAEAPGLHLRVREDRGRYLQEHVPFDAARFRLPRLDTSGAADPVAAAVELVRDQLACPPRMEALFAPPAGRAPRDARTAPLTGTVLVRVGPERHLLFQYFHHLAVDGYGVALLSRRIADVYTALVRGAAPRPSPFAPVSVLVDAERAYAGSHQEAADRAHWAARYADRPSAATFSGRSAPAGNGVLRRTVLLGGADLTRLDEAVRAARATWAEAVTTALAARLHLDTGAPEAVMRMYVMARPDPGTLRVPGMAVNVLPVRIPVDGDTTFRELLRRTAAEFASVRAHQRYRGEVLAREIWPGSATGSLPGPLLNLRPFATELDFAGVTGRVVTLASGPVDDLSLSAVRLPDGRLRLDFEANAACYEPAELAAVAAGHADLMRRLAREPCRPLQEPVPNSSLPATTVTPTQGEAR
ncbi:condensation domain-containing protein [Streptomyces sp. NPDC091376]|uniref:condensation domain-containing protein n=1 Tax=Streptomyces sp. NPDC091376 TaxID=3365994 RepID=UPI00382D0D7A